MTKPIPRVIYDPAAAREAGVDCLVEWDTRDIDSPAWETGRLWWARAGRNAEMVEYTRRGLGLVRWYDFKGSVYADNEPGSKSRRSATVDYVNKALAAGPWKDHACWHGATQAPDPNYCPSECDVCGGHWLMPDFAFTADTIVGQVFNAHTYQHLGRVEPEKGVAALFEWLDTEYPLPHPGFRAGQVWAREDELYGGWATTLVRRATTDGTAWLPARDEDHDVMRNAILLYDPLMPSRAPWSP